VFCGSSIHKPLAYSFGVRSILECKRKVSFLLNVVVRTESRECWTSFLSHRCTKVPSMLSQGLASFDVSKLIVDQVEFNDRKDILTMPLVLVEFLG
jgi:hypothetical protein